MFSIFKRKKDPTSAELLLGLSDSHFVSKVSELIAMGPPNAQVMRLIAYENLEFFMRVMSEIKSEKSNQEIPSSIEEYILYIERAIDPNPDKEVAARRLGWFFQAALLKRAEGIWQNSSEYDEVMAKMWITIADGCYCLPNVIQNVIIWNDREKVLLRHIESEKEAITYCLNLVAPKEVLKLEPVKEYAREKGIWLVT